VVAKDPADMDDTVYLVTAYVLYMKFYEAVVYKDPLPGLQLARKIGIIGRDFFVVSFYIAYFVIFL